MGLGLVCLCVRFSWVSPWLRACLCVQAVGGMLRVIGVSLCLPQCVQVMLCVVSLCWFVRHGVGGTTALFV